MGYLKRNMTETNKYYFYPVVSYLLLTVHDTVVQPLKVIFSLVIFTHLILPLICWSFPLLSLKLEGNICIGTVGVWER